MTDRLWYCFKKKSVRGIRSFAAHGHRSKFRIPYRNILQAWYCKKKFENSCDRGMCPPTWNPQAVQYLSKIDSRKVFVIACRLRIFRCRLKRKIKIKIRIPCYTFRFYRHHFHACGCHHRCRCHIAPANHSVTTIFILFSFISFKIKQYSSINNTLPASCHPARLETACNSWEIGCQQQSNIDRQ